MSVVMQGLACRTAAEEPVTRNEEGQQFRTNLVQGDQPSSSTSSTLWLRDPSLHLDGATNKIATLQPVSNTPIPLAGKEYHVLVAVAKKSSTANH